MGGDILDTQPMPAALAETLGKETVGDRAYLPHGLSALQSATADYR
jgi:hypothetical protein